MRTSLVPRQIINLCFPFFRFQLESSVSDLREAFAVVEVSSPQFVATFLEAVVRRCASDQDEAKLKKGLKKLFNR